MGIIIFCVVIAMKSFKLRKLACILSSLLLTSISSKISCMNSIKDAYVSGMPIENSYILDVKSIFNSRGICWGLRGDPEFFNYLKEYFSNKKIKGDYTSKDFENEIYGVFKEVSGKELKLYENSEDGWAYVKAFDKGGMSGGGIDGNRWIKEIIPVLKKRFEQALQIKKSENLCYSVEKLLKENADKIEQSDKDSLNQKVADLRKKLSENNMEEIKKLRKVADLRKKLSENNMEEIKKSRDELQKNMFDVSSKLYQQNAQQPEQNSQQNTQNNNGAQGNENVYDANYKDVNENDKE